MSDMKLIMENWRDYQADEPLTEGKAADLWAAAQEDILNIKTGQTPSATVSALQKQFKELRGLRLKAALEKLKKMFEKLADEEEAGRTSRDPSKVDLRIDKPANMIHDIEVAQDIVDNFPDKTYEEIQAACAGKWCRRVRSSIEKYGNEKISAVANSMGRMLGILATLAPALETGAEAAMAEQITKSDK